MRKLCSTNEAGQYRVGIRLSRRAAANLDHLRTHFSAKLGRDVSATLVLRLGLAVLREYLDRLAAQGNEQAAQALTMRLVREIR